ncbi:molybdenum cofactor guanylyltransferase [Glaciecola siphonariae]|uniref:Molybdenum cofactor guanylyltransferase n=1 Tax=Glaciecola siphonariae TaxID=521012 RepID=A0ABV9LVE2_9ALTE
MSDASEATSFSVLILAGGQSRRMKQTKSELLFQGSSFLEHARELASSLAPQDILLSSNTHAKAIPDVVSACGPLGGIYAASEFCKHSLLVLPVDMPLLSKGILLPMLEHGLHNNVSTYFNDAPLPLFLHASTHYQSYIKERIHAYQSDKSTKAQLSLYRLIEHVNAHALPGDEQVLKNINSPDDYRWLLAQHQNN